MFKKYTTLFLFLLMCLASSAQTLEQLARQNFLDGKYAEAKPQLKRCLKTAPKDARINYWYGACCIETGEIDEAFDYLTFAASKKIQNAHRYLGRYHYLKGHYAEAITALENYMAVASPSDDFYEDAVQLLQEVRARQKFMRRVEKVTFVDSIVVDKREFLDAYHIGSEAGGVMSYNQYFNSTKGGDCTVCISEMNNKLWYSCPTDSGRTALFASYKMAGEWGDPLPLKGLPEEGDNAYPFMLSDGVTFYFANNGPQSMGGWDIFVTRYNSDSDRFLRSDNAGMPFNSEDNDYLMVIDELNGLGWFASDRRQPEGKVCIYTFVWNDGRKEYYDSDELDAATLRRYADIASIEATQTDQDAVRKARQTLFRLSLDASNGADKQASAGAFHFVLDDLSDYTKLSDFHSETARTLYEQYLSVSKSLTEMESRLAALRDKWANASSSDRKQLSKEILSLEDECQTLVEQLQKLEIRVRAAEKEQNK